MNIPIFDSKAGPFLGCINLLAGAQHFTAPRAAIYHNGARAHHAALVQALRMAQNQA